MTIDEFKKDIAPHMNRGWIRKGTIAPVKWGNFTCCGFMLSCLGNLTEKCAKNCEVIGNIHENKELLK